MIVPEPVAVAGGDRRHHAGRREGRHGGVDVTVMVMVAAIGFMAGMQAGMIVIIIQRDIAEQGMFMGAGIAVHVLHAIDDAGGARLQEHQRQRDAQDGADAAGRYVEQFQHGQMLARAADGFNTTLPCRRRHHFAARATAAWTQKQLGCFTS